MRLSQWFRAAPLLLPLAGLPAAVHSAPLQLSSSVAARATAVSGPVMSLSASWHYFGRLNAGDSSDPYDFTIGNTGDAPLTITALLHSNPGVGLSASVGSLPVTIAPGGSLVMTTSFTASGSGLKSDVITIDGDAVNGDFPVLLQGTANTAPVFDPPLASDVSASAFASFSLVATATDGEGDAVSWSIQSAPPLPVGATFDGVTGAFSWTPSPIDAGDYVVTITLSDGLAQRDGVFTLHVVVSNRPPTADPGPTYTGIVGEPVAFDGTGSSDPDDGQTLTFFWDFGDEHQGVGPTPSHTYDRTGEYLVTLTVTDDGTPSFSHVALTGASIVDAIQLDIVQPVGDLPIIKTTGNRQQKFGIECLFRAVTDIDLATLVLRTTYPNAGSISELPLEIGKNFKISDINKNMIYDLDFAIRPTDIKPLLLHIPNGTFFTLVLNGHPVGDPKTVMRGSIGLIKSGPAGVASVAAPNPFRPGTGIHYTLREDGPVSIRIYSVEGKLVRTLKQGEYTGAGDHEATWDGLDDQGRRVVSGMYFVKTTARDETSVLKLVVMK